MAIDRSLAGPAELIAGSDHELSRDVGVLLVRCLLGAVLMADGARRLLGWFGGDGLLGSSDSLATPGYSPTEFLAVVGGVVTFLGGMFLLVGLLVPVAGAAAMAVLLGAVGAAGVDPRHHLLGSEGGLTLELVAIAAIAAVVLAGPGRLALDRDDIPAPTRWGALVVGVVCGLALIILQPV